MKALLQRADELLAEEPDFEGLGDYSLDEIVERLAANRPRVAIIQGSADHPAHMFDYEHTLRAAARVWQNGGVPFTFGIPVICDGTAQSNIGQSYSLASRNHTAMAVNINFEGHSYHAAYVLSGCDKTPTGILSGLAAADRAPPRIGARHRTGLGGIRTGACAQGRYDSEAHAQGVARYPGCRRRSWQFAVGQRHRRELPLHPAVLLHGGFPGSADPCC